MKWRDWAGEDNRTLGIAAEVSVRTAKKQREWRKGSLERVSRDQGDG